jgi:hypothetical protein
MGGQRWKEKRMAQIRYLIPILLLIGLAIVIPVSATDHNITPIIPDDTWDLLGPQPGVATYFDHATFIDWNETRFFTKKESSLIYKYLGMTSPITYDGYYTMAMGSLRIAAPNDHDTQITLYYGTKSVGGSIKAVTPLIRYGCERNITLGGDNKSWPGCGFFDQESYHIGYAKDGDTNEIGVSLCDESRNCAFYPIDDVFNTPVYRIVISSNEPLDIVLLTFPSAWISQAVKSELEHPYKPPTAEDFANLWKKISDSLLSIATTIVAFQVIFFVNAPWLVLGIEVISTMFAFMDSGGSIFTALDKFWKNQIKIIDFFMTFIEFAEKHYIFMLALGVIVVISDLATAFLGG